VQLAPQVRLGQLVRRDLQVLKDRRAQRERPELPAPWVQRDRRALLVQLAPSVRLGQLVRQDLQDRKDRQAQRERPEQPEQPELLAL